MADRIAEWLRQADYDMDTAEYMHRGGRRFYAVFMCHLAVEKALKGLFEAKLGHAPPKTHNLMYLLSRAGVEPDADVGEFIAQLSQANVTTRYPDSLDSIQAQYSEAVVVHLLSRTRKALTWIKSTL